MARREYKNRGPCVSIIANISILRLREEHERPYVMINRLVLLLFSAAWQDGGAGKKLVTEPRQAGLPFELPPPAGLFAEQRGCT